MSKDIWHFPSEAPAYCFQCVFYDTASDEYHFGQYSPVFKHFRSGNSGWEHEEVQKFAFAEDIIACLAELDRTRKALDVAVDALKNIGDRYDEEIARSADEDDCADWFICSQDVMLLVEQATEQITALEQKD